MKKVYLLIAAILVLIFQVIAQEDIDFHGNPITAKEESYEPSNVLLNVSERNNPPTVIHAIPTPGEFVNDIAFDGKYLWVQGYDAFVLYQVSPIDGTVIKTIPISTQRPTGLTFDGNHLWVADNDNQLILKVDTLDGAVLEQFPTPADPNASYPGGLAWDSSSLWHNDTKSPTVDDFIDSTFNISTEGAILQAFNAKGEYPSGLAFDGEYLWSSYNIDPGIYKIDVSDFSIVDSIDAPGGIYPNGLAFDGQYLWVANNDADSIYQVDIGIVSSNFDVAFSTLQDIGVFPNPSTGKYTFDLSAIEKKDRLSISVYDALGRLIQKQIFNGNNDLSLDLSNYCSGLYLYAISNEEKLLGTGKLVKE